MRRDTTLPLRGPSLFFFFSKILDVLLSPLTWGMIFVLLGTSFWWQLHWQRLCSLAGFAILCFFSLPPVSNVLQRWTETPPLRTVRAHVTYDAAILMGGVTDLDAIATFGEASYNNNIERLLKTYDLLRTGRARYAIVSGGVPDARPNEPSEAKTLVDQLVAWGIDPSRLVIEPRSRNTRENAVESAAIARQRGWRSLVIITSAFHMTRALGCFRAVDLPVDTLPVDFRSHAASDHGNSWLPRSAALAQSTEAIHELSGRLIYRIRGYTKD